MTPILSSALRAESVPLVPIVDDLTHAQPWSGNHHDLRQALYQGSRLYQQDDGSVELGLPVPVARFKDHTPLFMMAPNIFFGGKEGTQRRREIGLWLPFNTIKGTVASIQGRFNVNLDNPDNPNETHVMSVDLRDMSWLVRKKLQNWNIEIRKKADRLKLKMHLRDHSEATSLSAAISADTLSHSRGRGVIVPDGHQGALFVFDALSAHLPESLTVYLQNQGLMETPTAPNVRIPDVIDWGGITTLNLQEVGRPKLHSRHLANHEISSRTFRAITSHFANVRVGPPMPYTRGIRA